MIKGVTASPRKITGFQAVGETNRDPIANSRATSMAFAGAMMAKARQSREGGSWHVRVSLAQTGRWLWNLGRVADGLKARI